MGEFRGEDKILVVSQKGVLKIIPPELTTHFNDDMIVLEKWLPKKPISAIYFDGKNGFLFHFFASKMKNQTLKYSSYMHETRKKIGTNISIFSGNIISYEEMKNIKDRVELTDYLKNITYSLKKD